MSPGPDVAAIALRSQKLRLDFSTALLLDHLNAPYEHVKLFQGSPHHVFVFCLGENFVSKDLLVTIYNRYCSFVAACFNS